MSTKTEQKVPPAKPFLLTVPHAGERVPVEAPWLALLPEELLMFDVDRFVDRLYAPVIAKLGLTTIQTEWHRYAIDLNRLPTDVDCDSVQNSENPSGSFPRGLHWSITTTGLKLMPGPMSKAVHDVLVERYFNPFHSAVRAQLASFRQAGAPITYHLDAHSMPSVGTAEHADPGERRADVVVSDCKGTSCSPFFRDLVVQAYEAVGFRVAYNWPYVGGGITKTYGRPAEKQETIQVEFNRALYMNEKTKKLLADRVADIQARLQRAIEAIYSQMPQFPS